MSKRKATYASKMKRATHMLFFKRHSKPGVKGWELRKALGSDYPKVLKILDDYLKNLDLEIKTVFIEFIAAAPGPYYHTLELRQVVRYGGHPFEVLLGYEKGF